jgi:hypothetical protein
VFGEVARFPPDSARTKIPSAKMAATQKINRAALDIFILWFFSTRQRLGFCSVEPHPPLCDSVPGILRRRLQTTQAESLDGKQNRMNPRRETVTELLLLQCAEYFPDRDRSALVATRALTSAGTPGYGMGRGLPTGVGRGV